MNANGARRWTVGIALLAALGGPATARAATPALDCGAGAAAPSIVLDPPRPPPIDPDVPIGSLLHALTPGRPIARDAGCPLLDGVYPTSIPGIGLRFRPRPGGLDAELAKTGPIAAGGVLSGEITTVPRLGLRWARPLEITLRRPTCTVLNPALAVDIGAVPARGFSGIGSTSRARDFRIALQCANLGAGTRIHVALTDVVDPGNTSRVLNLAPSSSASGVGVQLRSGPTILSYGPDGAAPGSPNRWPAGSGADGSVDIPLSARFVQTGARVVPGTAQARASFTLSYE